MKAASTSTDRSRAPRGVVPAFAALLGLLAVLSFAAAPAAAATPNFCPPGSAAGQCNGPVAVAVDQSSGTVYVADFSNNRIDVFDSSGHFLRAFGFGVVNGENVLQTCTAVCIQGRPGLRASALAVDNTAGPSAGDLYAFDEAKVEKYRFDPLTEEEELLPGTFGGPGTGPGEFSGSSHPLAVDASGNVWAGDVNRLEEFSEAGAFLAEVKLPTAGAVRSLAVDASGFYAVIAPNAIQKVTPPGSGTYTLSYPAGTLETTSPISFGASAAEVKGALEAGIRFFHEYNVEGPAGGPYTVEIIGTAEFGEGSVAQLIASAGSATTVQENGVVRQVDKLKPDGELIETLDSSGHPNALALDPASGDLFVSDQLEPDHSVNAGKATLLEFGPGGAQSATFGAGEVIGGPRGSALALGSGGDRLYTVSSRGLGESAAQAFIVPPPGPLPESGTTKATPIGKVTASLCAEVNPEGAATTAHFQYITAAAYKEDGESFGPGTEVTAESTSIGADFEGHEICQPVSALQPAGAYRFRVVATNANGPSGGTPGEAAEFATLPPAAIDSTGATSVTADSATLVAEIDPLGEETFYRFEFLPEAAYQRNQAEGLAPFAGAALAPTVDVDLGAGSSDVPVSQHLQGLQSATVYRYRVLIHNATSEAHGGPFAGPTRAFTTQSILAATLLDGRAWELVSPAEKHGASLEPIAEAGLIQAAASGDAITYLASAPTEAEPQGNSNQIQVLSARGPGGWSATDLAPPHSGATSSPAGFGQEYRAFSPDLSVGAVQPLGPFEPSLSPQASEQTPFVHTNFPAADPTAFCAGSCYRPLVTGAAGVANVPPGTEFGRQVLVAGGDCHPGAACGPAFVGATPDLSHVIVESRVALTLTPLSGSNQKGLYEFSAAAPPAEALRLISALPGGAPAISGPGLGAEGGNARGAISADGSRVVFSTTEHHLYLRLNATAEPTASGECSPTEPALACTIELDQVQAGAPGGSQAPGAAFQIAAADTSRIFFTDTQQLTPGSGTSADGGDLYEYDLDKPAGERLTDLTPEAGGEAVAVQRLVSGASADGSYLYFVADGRLARGAVDGNCRQEGNELSGSCNLYLRHDGATSLVAVLSAKDQGEVFPFNGLGGLTARVSADGRWLAFMSERELTGYDNHDATSGEPDQEVYLYHASAGAGEEGRLICASCNPTGARPHGVEYHKNGGTSESNLPLVGGDRVWEADSWLAANVPGWTPYRLEKALYQSRYLSDSGRLFFNSSDALVPADSNGQEDVYEYEPPGVGDCTTSSPTFGAASEGCVDLVSSGTSPEESAFLDASESGDDVFFLTSARLSRRDPDSSLDVYDARVGGGEAEATPPVECSGDGCQQPAVPPDDQTPGSLSFSGAGNVLECPKGKVVKAGRCVTKQHGKKHKKGKKHKQKHGKKSPHKQAAKRSGGSK